MKRGVVSYYPVGYIIHHFIEQTARIPLIAFIIISIILHFTDIAHSKETTIYRYKDNNGVVFFTDNIDSIPESLRNQAEAIGKKRIKEIEAPAPKNWSQNIPGVQSIQDFLLNGWKNHRVKALLVIVVILLLLYLKLWIKNVIFKFIARIAIKVAIGALLYIAGHYLYRQAFPVNPIKRAEENIGQFQEKQEERKQALDALGLQP